MMMSLLSLITLAASLSAADTLATPALAPVPSWARDAVWYQIFPERFSNGDSTNDPTVDDIDGAWPHERPAVWHRSPWTADWFKLQPWEQADGKGFYYHAQLRRFGGDLEGIRKKLDYLQSLGVTALYLNPVFESPSLHKYDATMYHHIDNNFGPHPAQDRALWQSENPADPSTWRWTTADTMFLGLVREVHRRHMKIILDGVFNHVGTTFWAFTQARREGPTSPYAGWFTITSWDNPATPQDEFDYKGWLGVKDLPELRKDSVLGLAAGPAAHIHAVLKRWMDPNGDGDPSDGIDGWRLDVADMVPLTFWRQFRTWVRALNPEAYITGEIWWKDWAADSMFNADPWLRGDAFDAVMNYRWAREVCRFFKDHARKIGAGELVRRLAAIRADYRDDANAVLMNLLDSHDTDRLASMIVNPDTKYDHAVGTADNKDYDVRKPNDRERAIQRLMVAFQMTWYGAPMVYYGDEAGMWGGDDPDERKPMLWKEFTYEHEASHPFGMPRPDDVNAFDPALFSWYRDLIHLRRAHPALRGGTIDPLVANDSLDVLVYARTKGKDQVVVLINATARTQSVSRALLPPPSLRRLFGAGTIGKGAVTLPARQVLILEVGR